MIFIKKTTIDAPVEPLFAWHATKGAIQRLTPPWAPMKLLSRNQDGIQTGVRVKFLLSLFKVPVIWEARHIAYQENRLFKDRQLRGPFARWEHIHQFIPVDLDKTVMVDKVHFELPMGRLSRPFYAFAQKKMKTMFDYRHRVLKYDLENYQRNTNPMNILISGASGTIGQALIPLLQTSGHKVFQLVRKKENLSDNQLFWDPYNNILDIEKAGTIDAVINLNGVDISKGRWTEKRKQLILDSRIIPTRFLAGKAAELSPRPKVFITASAMGFYGNQAGKMAENSPKGALFISDVCKQWEDAAHTARKSGIRTVMLRTGIVLTPAGGALAKMMLPFQLGLGVILSTGTQMMSWISMDDEISAIRFILENETVEGPVNLTAPTPVTNREFSDTLAKAFSKRVFFTMPEFLIKLIWGEMGKETLLSSINVHPLKLLNNGFKFQHDTLLEALKHLLGR